MKNWKVQEFPDSGKTGKCRGFQNPRHYSMSPKSLNLDKSVSDGAFRVFSILALQNYQKGRKTSVVQMSTREIADLKGASHTTIRKWLGELATGGYIEKLGSARGKAAFRLTGPMFQSNFRVQAAPGVVADVETSQLPIVRDKKRRCPKCKRVERITSTSGVCDQCLSEWVARGKVTA